MFLAKGNDMTQEIKKGITIPAWGLDTILAISLFCYVQYSSTIAALFMFAIVGFNFICSVFLLAVLTVLPIQKIYKTPISIFKRYGYFCIEIIFLFIFAHINSTVHTFALYFLSWMQAFIIISRVAMICRQRYIVNKYGYTERGDKNEVSKV